jgi:hypothetical protein
MSDKLTNYRLTKRSRAVVCNLWKLKHFFHEFQTAKQLVDLLIKCVTGLSLVIDKKRNHYIISMNLAFL